MKKGFTLMELLIVIIIIGILASLALPQYLKINLKAQVAKAKNALALVARAEKLYRAKYAAYLAIAKDGFGASALNEDVDLSDLDNDDDWDYAVSVSTGPDAFTITATKINVPCDKKTIKLDNKNVFTLDACFP